MPRYGRDSGALPTLDFSRIPHGDAYGPQTTHTGKLSHPQLVKKALKANRNFMDAFLVMSSMYGYHHKSADNYDVARCAAIVSRAHDLFDSSHPGLYGSLHTSRKASHQAAHSPQKYAKTYREYTRRDRNNSSASSSASASAAKYRTHSDSSPYSFRAPGMKRGVMDDAAGANSARPPTRPPPAHLRSGRGKRAAASAIEAYRSAVSDIKNRHGRRSNKNVDSDSRGDRSERRSRKPRSSSAASPAKTRQLLVSHMQGLIEGFSRRDEDMLDDAFVREITEAGGGWSGLSQHLKRLSAIQRRFKDIDSVLYAVKNGQEDGDYLSHRMTDSLLSALDKGCVLVEPSSPDDLSTRELNDLVYRARGVDACVSRIEGYSGVGRSFASVRELLDAIQQHGKDDSHLAYKEQSNLLRVIRSTDVLVKERADSNGDKEGYSSRDRARKRGKDRDRDTSSHIRPHPHELDKIAAAGGGVGPCMEGLQKFKDFNQSFFSIDSLCKALKKARKTGSYVSEADRKALVEHLHLPHVHILEEMESVSVTAKELDRIICASGSLAKACSHIDEFEKLHRRFYEFNEIAPAITEVNASGSHSSKSDVDKVRAYIESDRCSLFSECRNEPSHSSAQIDVLISQAGGSTPLLLHLEEFERTKRRFASHRQLQEAVDSVHNGGDSYVSAADRKMLLSTLKHPSCAVLSTRLLDDLGEKERVEGLDSLVYGADGDARYAVECIDGFQGVGREFRSFADLKAGIQRARGDGSFSSSHTRRRITEFLESSRLFSDQAIVDDIRGKDIDELVQVTGSVDEIMKHLEALETHGRMFSSLEDLIRTIREVHSTDLHISMEDLRAIAEYLGDFKCKLLKPSKTKASIMKSGAHVEKIILAGGGSAQSCIDHFDMFQKVSRSFRSLPDLAEATKIAQKKKCHLDKASRQAIIEYLGSDDCMLFSESDAENIALRGSDLDTLVAEGGGDVTKLLAHMRRFDYVHRKFYAARDLIPAVNDAEETTFHIQVKDRNSVVTFLKNDARKLLQDSDEYPEDLQDTKNASRFEDMMHHAQGLAPLLEHLTGFCQVDRVFDSIDELVIAIRSASETGMHTCIEIKNTIFEFLEKDPSELIRGRVFGVTGSDIDTLMKSARDIDGVMQSFRKFADVGRKFDAFSELAPAIEMAMEKKHHVSEVDRGSLVGVLETSRLFSELRGDKRISARDLQHLVSGRTLDSLVIAGQGLEDTVKYIKQFDDNDRKFDSVEDLIPAIEKFSELGEDSHRVIEYLTSKDCRLFRSPLYAKDIVEADVMQLVHECKGVSNTLNHLRMFEQVGREFKKMNPDLIQAAKSAHKKKCHLDKASRQAIIDYLGSPQCMLFSESDAENIALRGSDLDTLVAEGGGDVTKLLAHMRRFDYVHRKFYAARDLVPAVNHAEETGFHVTVESQNAVIDHLSNAESDLLAGAKVNAEDLRHEDSIDVLEEMFHESKGLRPLCVHFTKFSEVRRTFTSLEELSGALVTATKTGMHVSNEVREMIVEYLVKDESTMFGSNTQLRVKGKNIDELVMKAKGIRGVIQHFEAFDKIRRKFTAFTDLAPAIESAISSRHHVGEMERGSLIGVMQRSKLFTETKGNDRITSADLEHLVAGPGLDDLVIAGQGVENTIKYIRQFDSSGRKFQKFVDLIPALEKIAELGEDPHDVMQYITSQDCRLFESPLYAKDLVDEDVMQLIHECKGVPNTLNHLRMFEQVGRVFRSINPELISAAKSARKKKCHLDKASRQAIIDYLGSPQCMLFSESDAENIALRGSDLDTLVAEGGGDVTKLLAHMRRFDYVHRKFYAARDLVPAVNHAEETGHHFSDASSKAIKTHLQSSRSSLISDVRLSTSSWGGELNENLEEVLHFGKGLHGTLDHVRKFEAVGRTFPDTHEMCKAFIKASKLGTHILEEDAQTIIEYLCSKHSKMFNHIDQLEIRASQFDAILINGGQNIKKVMRHLKTFDNVGRMIKTVADLPDALKRASKTGHHVSEDDRLELVQVLQNSKLFYDRKKGAAIVEPGALEGHVVGKELDDLVSAGKKMKRVLGFLREFETKAREFDTFSQLIPAIKKRMHTLIAHRKRVFTYIASVDSNFFTSDIHIQTDDLDVLISTVTPDKSGINLLMRVLEDINGSNKQFVAFQDLLKDVEKATKDALNKLSVEPPAASSSRSPSASPRGKSRGVKGVLELQKGEGVPEAFKTFIEYQKEENRNKMPRNATVHFAIHCRGLPKLDSFGLSDPFLEFYRYRAYKDQVSSVVWEKIKHNLWQKVYSTPHLVNTLDPVFPDFLIKADFCKSEYDRPVLIKAFDWNKVGKSEFMGEMHTDLLQIMEQSQADEPFDLLNNEWVKKKKRGYVNSGRVKFKTCEVYVQRSSIAVIGLMLAIETGLHYQAFKDIQSRFMKGAKVKKIEAAALPAQPPPPTGPANVSVKVHVGSIAGIAAGKENETKCKLRIQIIGSSLPRMDTFGEADPFVEIHRQSDEYYHRDMELKTGEHKEAWTLVHTTETIEHSLSPKFKPFILSVWDACKGDYLRPLKFRCMDWNKTGASDFIGEFQTTLFDIFKQNEPFKLIDARNQNKQDYQHSGKLEVRVKLNSKEELAAWDEDFKEVLKPIITAYKSSNSSSSGRSGLSSRKKKDNKKKANSALDLKIKMQEQHAQKFAKR